MQSTLWFLFYVFATNISTVGPYDSEATCERVKKQIVREFGPKRAACIDIGAPPQVRAPVPQPPSAAPPQ